MQIPCPRSSSKLSSLLPDYSHVPCDTCCMTCDRVAHEEPTSRKTDSSVSTTVTCRPSHVPSPLQSTRGPGVDRLGMLQASWLPKHWVDVSVVLHLKTVVRRWSSYTGSFKARRVLTLTYTWTVPRQWPPIALQRRELQPATARLPGRGAQAWLQPLEF